MLGGITVPVGDDVGQVFFKGEANRQAHLRREFVLPHELLNHLMKPLKFLRLVLQSDV